jgi:TP901 family phage tail tape measure protein
MADGDPLMTEAVQLNVTAPYVKSNLKGLDEATARLTALDSILKTVQNRLAGLTTGSQFKLSAAQFAAKAFTPAGQKVTDVRKLAKMWGFPDVKDLQFIAQETENELQRSVTRAQNKLDKLSQASTSKRSTAARAALKKEISDLQAQSYFTNPTATTFKNPTRAGAFAAEKYAPNLLTNKLDAEKLMAGLLGGTVAWPVPPKLSPGQAGYLKIPAAREAEKSGGGGDAPWQVAKASRTRAGAKFQDDLTAIKLELARNLNTGDLTMVAGARSRAAEQVRALVASDPDGKIKQRAKNKALTYAADQERLGVQTAQTAVTQSSQEVFNLRKKLDAAQKAGQKEKAKQLQKELDAEEAFYAQRVAQAKALNTTFYKPQQAQQKRSAAEAAKLAAFNEAERQRQEQHIAVAKQWQTFMAQPDARETPRSGRMTLGKDGQWTRLLEGERTLPDGRIQRFRADLGHTATSQTGLVQPPKSKTQLQSAVEGLSAENMSAKFLKVASWSAVAIPVYTAMTKSIELADYSLQRLEKTGLQMAHLGLVFRGVGGNAQQLTGDILKLAASEGRSTDEAMESATEWARLGGDRAAVNEEVRVSAMAANIGEMSMLESTKQLSALMHIYHLNAGDLNGTLGMLTNTSLKYNVTLDEMFVGLDRSAAAAKVAGVGLAELQAMIGVVVGGTGQSGSMTGNSIKYILQELNKPDIQKQLRRFGIEPLTNQLNAKPGGQILSELSGVWGTLGQRQQGSLSTALGGRFNAARVPIVLENYPKILELAIEGQLNLNKAQDANVKILETMHAQLAGVRTEWDRLVMNSGTLTGLTEASRTAKNVLKFFAGNDVDSSSAPEVKKLSDTDISGLLNKNYLSQEFSWFTGKSDARKKYGADYENQLENELARRNLAKNKGRVFGTGPHSAAVSPDQWFNAWSEYQPSVAGQDDYQTRAADLKRNNQANEYRVQQFNMARTMLQNGTMTDENKNIFAQTMEGMAGGGALANQFLNGSPDAKLKAVDTANAQAMAAAQQGKKDAADAAQKNFADLTTQKKTLEEAIAKQGGSGHATADQKTQEQALNKALEDSKTDVSDLGKAYEDTAGDVEAVIEATQSYISLMKTQAVVMQSIARIGSLVKASTPLGEMDQQAAIAKRQLEFIRGQMEMSDPSNESDPGKKFEKGYIYGKLTDELKKAQALYDANTDSTNRGLAEREGDVVSGSRDVQRGASGQKYGATETAKLDNERAYLKEKIAALNAEEIRTDRQDGELLEAKNLLHENTLSLLQRQQDVQREIKQLAIDQNKEFMKSFMGAGPAEMLQKLAAFKINMANPKGLSQGAFFGMGASTRGDLGMLNPQYNPDMIFLKQERARINADVAGLTPPQSDLEKKLNSGVQSLLNGIKNFADMLTGGKHAQTMDTAITSLASGIDPGAKGSAGGKLVEAISQLATQVTQHLASGRSRNSVGFHQPVNAQSGGLGGGKGVSTHGGGGGTW